MLLEAVTAAGARVVPSSTYDDEVLRRGARPGAARPPAHRRRRLGRGGATSRWSGRTGWCRTSSRRRACSTACPCTPPAATHARAGVWCYDTMTLVGPGTWTAARAAVDVTLTAVDLVVGGAALGVRAGPAARAPRDPARVRRLLLPQQRGGRGRGAARARRGAGGGRRHRRAPRQRHPGDVLGARATCSTARCTSTRGPAGSRTSSGYAEERGARRRRRGHVNLPLAPGTGDDGLAGRARPTCCSARRASGAEALVVSLGVDAAGADPESPLEVSTEGFRAAGERAGRPGPADRAGARGRLRPRPPRCGHRRRAVARSGR